MDKFELPKDPKDLKNYNPVAILEETFTLPEETTKDKAIKNTKKISRVIWSGIKVVYKNIPEIVLGILFLYLLFQVILFIGHTNTQYTNWKWATELAKNSPFHCFLAGTTFWASLSKLLLFIFTGCVLIFSLFLMAEVITEGPLQYIIVAVIVGVMFCLFNNKIYDFISILSIPLCIVGCMVTGGCFSGGGRGGSSSSSYEYKDSNNWHNIEKEKQEKYRIEKEQKERQYEQDERERAEKEKQRQKDAETIISAYHRGDNLITIEFANGHTRSFMGTLVNYSPNSITVNDKQGWQHTYDGKLNHKFGRPLR